MFRVLFLLLWYLRLGIQYVEGYSERSQESPDFRFGSHNSWAVLVDTSRYFSNYRHAANVVAIYNNIKRLGMPDSRIILMLAEDQACNPRNAAPGYIVVNSSAPCDLYNGNIEVDFRGPEVTPQSVVQLFTGRWGSHAPSHKRLDTNADSNIIVYLTGHGGDEFIKFHDSLELTSYELAFAFHQMYLQRRMKQLFFITDSCQASTLYNRFYTSGILGVGCSLLGENSYSHFDDSVLGVPIIDKFSYNVVKFLERLNESSEATLQNLFDQFDPAFINSNPGIRLDLFENRPNETRILDFFGQRTVDYSILAKWAPHSNRNEKMVPDSTMIDVRASVPYIFTEADTSYSFPYGKE